MDKLLAKDVAKGKIREEDARDAKERVQVGQPGEMGDVDMVVEVSGGFRLDFSVVRG
jgi:3-hydroxyacyl-CoA dehydrogenase